MSVILLDANAIIAHGRGFPDRAKAAAERGERLVLPQSVKRELVDDVLKKDDAPENHRGSARAIEQVIEEEHVRVREPDFDRFGESIDQARRRIADDSLPEHEIKADQYIPALVCELAQNEDVIVVTGDRKLGNTIEDIADKHNLAHEVSIRDPRSVL